MVTSITEPCINKCCVTEWKLHYEVDVVSQDSVQKWYFEQF